MNSLDLIAAVKARRAAAGLVAKNGAHCATPAQRDYLDARHGLTREQIEADADNLTKLRNAARKGV
jgi:hypothetical protein